MSHHSIQCNYLFLQLLGVVMLSVR